MKKGTYSITNYSKDIMMEEFYWYSANLIQTAIDETLALAAWNFGSHFLRTSNFHPQTMDPILELFGNHRV